MNNLKDKLFELSDEKYKKFHSGLCPNTDNIIGVRLPKLREIAKEIAKGDWKDFLATSSNDYYEEVMINGLVIAYAKCDVDEKLNYIESFVPKIDNWAICDSFCNSLKFVNKNKEKVWEFIQPYLKSNKEFEIRFAVVIILNYYITEDYIDLILETLDEVKHEGYYVNESYNQIDEKIIFILNNINFILYKGGIFYEEIRRYYYRCRAFWDFLCI